LGGRERDLRVGGGRCRGRSWRSSGGRRRREEVAQALFRAESELDAAGRALILQASIPAMSDEQREAASTTSGLASTAHTFLFADLADFAALTEAHGDEEAADLVGSFRVQVSEMLPQHGAEQVKTIGDALMILTASATNAVRLAVRIVNEVGGRHRFRRYASASTRDRRWHERTTGSERP